MALVCELCHTQPDWQKLKFIFLFKYFLRLSSSTGILLNSKNQKNGLHGNCIDSKRICSKYNLCNDVLCSANANVNESNVHFFVHRAYDHECLCMYVCCPFLTTPILGLNRILYFFVC